MLTNDISSNLADINIAHLYFNDIVLEELYSIKDSFLNYTDINLSDSFISDLQANVLFIELKALNKNNFKILNEIVKKNTSKEIYIFATDNENTFLLKFALHFSLHKIYPLINDKNELDKIFKEIVKKISIKKEEKQQVEISKKINSFFSLLILKKDRLVFANEKAKRLFDSDKLQDIEDIIKNNEELYFLISKKEKSQKSVIMETIDGEEWHYNFFLDFFENNEDKLITIVPQNKVINDASFLATINRFKFIEMLKDRLAQNSINNTPMSLISINISNYYKLVDACGSIIIHDFLKKFIDKLCLYKDSCQDLSQWNPHLFVFIIERENFETVKNMLDSMHQKLVYSDIDETISPIITSSALNIGKFDINDVLQCIEQISEHSFTCNDFNSDDFFEINHFNNYISEEEQISHYLSSCIGNQTPLKLLNIYKGLCINTTSKIIKTKDNLYYVHCENLQGYAMQLEDKTIIQAPDLPNDLEADIVFVNIEKSFAVLDNLMFLKTSANNRQNTRVQPNIRTPITIKYMKNSYQGDIIDISTQAIAIKLNHLLSSELVGKNVDILFKLLDSSKEEGYSQMQIIAKVVFVKEIDVTKTKIVLMINPEKPYDSYLLKYMYDRQKELILELKRVVRANHKKRA